MRHEKETRARAAYCVRFGDRKPTERFGRGHSVPGLAERPPLDISPLPVNSHLDLPIVRSHLRMVVVAAERRRGLRMRSLETVLARAGKTKDQFYAYCDQIAAPYRAWMFEMAEDNDGA